MSKVTDVTSMLVSDGQVSKARTEMADQQQIELGAKSRPSKRFGKLRKKLAGLKKQIQSIQNDREKREKLLAEFERVKFEVDKLEKDDVSSLGVELRHGVEVDNVAGQFEAKLTLGAEGVTTGDQKGATNVAVPEKLFVASQPSDAEGGGDAQFSTTYYPSETGADELVTSRADEAKLSEIQLRVHRLEEQLEQVTDERDEAIGETGQLRRELSDAQLETGQLRRELSDAQLEIAKLKDSTGKESEWTVKQARAPRTPPTIRKQCEPFFRLAETLYHIRLANEKGLVTLRQTEVKLVRELLYLRGPHAHPPYDIRTYPDKQLKFDLENAKCLKDEDINRFLDLHKKELVGIEKEYLPVVEKEYNSFKSKNPRRSVSLFEFLQNECQRP